MDVFGKPIQLDGKQQEILNEFQEIFKGSKLPDSGDAYLLRWLIARNFDISQAEKMLRTSLEWRQVNQVDDILNSWKPPEVMEKYFPVGICGRDKFGCPILINAYGRADMRGIVQSVSKKDYTRYIVYMAEKAASEMRRTSQETNRVVNKQVMIVDMKHLEMRAIYDKRVMEYGLETVKMSEAHYPEALRRVFVINAPKVFTMFFNFVKTILHEVTVNKFQVYGTDSDKWTAALLEEIDADQLPVQYGGLLTGPEADSVRFLELPLGQVPQSYFVTSSKPRPTESMECTTISPGSRKMIEVPVPALNSVLRWQFLTEEADIGFRVYCMTGKDKVDVIPWERVASHLHLEEGMTVCTRTDTYHVEFDNSYSYMRSKKLWFAVSIDPPGGSSDNASQPGEK